MSKFIHMESNIDLNGVNLRVKHENLYENRPTIVFLHDSLGCIKLWRDFPKLLAEATKCNFFIYDREGYGLSSASRIKTRDKSYLVKEAITLKQLLDFFHINNAIIFGHSDGATIALIAAAKYPKTFLGIICEAAHVFVEEKTIEGIYAAVTRYNTTDLKSRLEKYHFEKTPVVFFSWTDTWTNESYRDWNIENLLPKIECPSLIIQGEADEYGTLKQVESIITKTKGQSIPFILSGIGHSPHKQDQKMILEKSIEFIHAIKMKNN